LCCGLDVQHRSSEKSLQFHFCVFNSIQFNRYIFVSIPSPRPTPQRPSLNPSNGRTSMHARESRDALSAVVSVTCQCLATRTRSSRLRRRRISKTAFALLCGRRLRRRGPIRKQRRARCARRCCTSYVEIAGIGQCGSRIGHIAEEIG
jgi:hypothetical protein